MNIVRGRPPNYAELVKCGQFRIPANAIFTYGDALYAPAGLIIDAPLIAHETAHSGYQCSMGIDTWWATYIADRQFRFEQELIGHRAEWAATDGFSRDARKARLHDIVQRLAGPLYGNMVTMKEARGLIGTA